jgi:hypothetical protein
LFDFFCQIGLGTLIYRFPGRINENLTTGFACGTHFAMTAYLLYMKLNQGIAAVITCVFLFTGQTKAQTGTANNRNLSSRAGYTAGNYYYYPEIDTWYDIPNRRFVYFENGRWFYSDAISGKYRYYDIASAYKVQVTEKKPYQHADAYRQLYIAYYTAYQNRFRTKGVLAVHVENDDRMNEHMPVFNNRSVIPENSRTEERQTIRNKQVTESKMPVNNKSSEIKSEEVYEPERFEEHKPVERGKIQPAEKTSGFSIDSKTGVRAKEENRAHIEPIKKEPVILPKIPEPVKTDSVPAINRSPGGSREAQYSDKFKKRVEE